VFGISVKHNLCDDRPSYVHECSNVDISIHNHCPGDNVKLLNISSNIADAEIGDSALAYGYHNNVGRAWTGMITGFRRNGNSSSDGLELLFQGDQLPGISGGATLNGKGLINNSTYSFITCI